MLTLHIVMLILHLLLLRFVAFVYIVLRSDLQPTGFLGARYLFAHDVFHLLQTQNCYILSHRALYSYNVSLWIMPTWLRW